MVGILLLGMICLSPSVRPSGRKVVSAADSSLGNSVGAIGSSLGMFGVLSLIWATIHTLG